MAKKNVKLSSLGNQHIKENLKRFYPFLNENFRTVTNKDIGNEESFKELFGSETLVNLEYIRALYIYQQCDTKHRTTSTSEPSETLPSK